MTGVWLSNPYRLLSTVFLHARRYQRGPQAAGRGEESRGSDGRVHSCRGAAEEELSRPLRYLWWRRRRQRRRDSEGERWPDGWRETPPLPANRQQPSLHTALAGRATRPARNATNCKLVNFAREFPRTRKFHRGARVSVHPVRGGGREGPLCRAPRPSSATVLSPLP